MMNIARIAYANTGPYFHFWPAAPFHLVNGTPRELAQAAKAGDILAGPLPVVECWPLENEFVPLGPWGIAGGERVRSVFVFSRRPFADLQDATIGLTTESSTSVLLCATLLHHKYNVTARLHRGLVPQDDAWLVIGNQALEMAAKADPAVWPYVTDLATEWWEWKKLPFVFARWVVRRDFPARDREALAATVRRSLAKGRENLVDVAAALAVELHLPPDHLYSYLSEIQYDLSPEAELSARIFRELAGGMPAGAAHVAATR